MLPSVNQLLSPTRTGQPQDEATPPPMSEELSALLPDARLHVLKGCAHVPPLQAPNAFLEAIGAFLQIKSRASAA